LNYIILFLALLYGCGGKDQKQETNNVDLDSARHNIIAAINNFNAAYMKKDWEGIKKLLSGTVHIFGTDSSAIINSVADYEKQLQKEWGAYDQGKLGAPNYLYIEMDKDAELASAVFQVMFVSVAGGKSMQIALRFSNTYKKENGEWKLVQMIMQNPLGQSTEVTGRK
jgi:ketosteroid isomerase-like protein